MRMAEYMGRHVASMFEVAPFKNWPFERSVEADLEELRIDYIFTGRALVIECDRNEAVCVIFMRREEYDGFILSEIPFTLGRKEVLDRLGVPSKSGEKISDPILGECGAWDRFVRSNFTIHVEYSADVDAINMITLMRSDVVP
jgi:hypothetical protein